MGFGDNINKYLAFKLKELEFRVHTWKRSKEISRAYDSRSARRNIDLGFVKPLAVKAAKVSAAAAVLFLLVFGIIKVIPFLPARSAQAADSADMFADEASMPLFEAIEDANLPEAAVMPEGYAEFAVTAQSADTAAAVEAEAPPVTPAPPPPPPSSGVVVADIFKNGLPRGIAERLILGDKAAKILYIFREGAGGWEIEKAYPMATGENDGRKEVEGDKKTPEGVYFIVGRKHRSELTNIYGPAAFISDYPNETDRREGRTGHGIWLHGSERGNIPPLFTQGCLAVANPDIIEITQILKDWAGTPIIIVSGTEGKKHLAAIDFRKMKERHEEVVTHHNKNQEEFRKLVMDWKTVWESKDIDAYSEYYSTAAFMDGSQKWEAYRERKIRTFAMYATINIDISGIVLTELTGNAATVKFHQVYATNLNRMDNGKRLIFRKEQDNWKIYREIPFPKEELVL